MTQGNAANEFMRWTMAIILSGILFGLGGIGYNTIERGISAKIKPRTEDLNLDGTSDCLVEDRKGFNTPWYGIKQDNSIIYMPETEFRRLYPEIKADYEGIRKRFQEQYTRDEQARQEKIKNLEKELQDEIKQL